MSHILEQIVDRYARQCELRAETAHRWLTTAELSELIEIETELHMRLWPKRQAELAGASELARLRADRAMKAGQASKNDTRRLV